MDTMDWQKNVIIVSVREGHTDDIIEDYLNAPIDRGYYLAFMLPPYEGNLRAVFKRSVIYVDPAQAAQHDAEEKKVLELLKANPGLTTTESLGLLEANGIKRAAPYLTQRRAFLRFSQ